jgi:NADPH-dependent 2,4-dienoyl-CoA reductase/sulfur reductase-like enzyme
MAAHVEKHIEKHGVPVLTDASIAEITESGVALSGGREIPADLVLLSTGVRPNTELAAAAGIELGVAGAIRVNPAMQTSVADIYAAGDCAEHIHLVTENPSGGRSAPPPTRPGGSPGTA